ncbi:MAG: hypothetical protein RR403_04325, partial [Pseudoflavonifractor sp.]
LSDQCEHWAAPPKGEPLEKFADISNIPYFADRSKREDGKTRKKPGMADMHKENRDAKLNFLKSHKKFFKRG